MFKHCLLEGHDLHTDARFVVKHKGSEHPKATGERPKATGDPRGRGIIVVKHEGSEHPKATGDQPLFVQT